MSEPINRERLAQALWSYVREHGWLELGGMDAIFMPGHFETVAAELAKLYDAGEAPPVTSNRDDRPTSA